ncbi:lysozyme (plasmid) [Erwinia tracheiphila]|uniref:lysozyme n=1 Tax=Erwinia tracheiphila TaxID=65700 RepID=UPI001F33DDFC|nr:lysozyme [Erwinia tracheiphila]UIA94555.1 lysozyme [Erwinia tracheiphila]
MQISDSGIMLIKNFEGLCLTAYQCSAHVWTIGYGHTAGVKPGDTITEGQAEQFLRDDLDQFEAAVYRLVNVTLSQHQFDALVSFTFNLGEGNLKNSTLLKKLNAGDYSGAAEEFPRWNRADGRVVEGLTRRRLAERDMFLA